MGDDDKKLIERQTKKIEEEIINIKSQKIGRIGSVFEMKELIDGPKKPSQEPTAIKDPVSGDLVVASTEIKRVTLAYCVDNLTQ